MWVDPMIIKWGTVFPSQRTPLPSHQIEGNTVRGFIMQGMHGEEDEISPINCLEVSHLVFGHILHTYMQMEMANVLDALKLATTLDIFAKVIC